MHLLLTHIPHFNSTTELRFDYFSSFRKWVQYFFLIILIFGFLAIVFYRAST